jgi:hypothetical protein
MLYPYIRLKEGDSLLDLKDSVWAAYCYAYERADFSCIAAQKPRPEFTRNTVFNWSPRGAAPNLSALDGTEDALTLSIIEYTPPILSYLEMDQEPEIQFRDMGAEIMCALYFSGKDLSETTMERFARNFLLFLRILVRTPEVRVKDVPFVS